MCILELAEERIGELEDKEMEISNLMNGKEKD